MHDDYPPVQHLANSLNIFPAPLLILSLLVHSYLLLNMLPRYQNLTPASFITLFCCFIFWTNLAHRCLTCPFLAALHSTIPPMDPLPISRLPALPWPQTLPRQAPDEQQHLCHIPFYRLTLIAPFYIYYLSAGAMQVRSTFILHITIQVVNGGSIISFFSVVLSPMHRDILSVQTIEIPENYYLSFNLVCCRRSLQRQSPRMETDYH